jgi:hypothetical protein
MELIAFAGTIVSQIIIACIYMNYISQSGASFISSLVIVIVIQLLVWTLYSIVSWVNYLIFLRKSLIDHYWHVFIARKFPRILKSNGDTVEPLEYFETILSNDIFDDRLKIAACTMHTEIMVLDKTNNFQEKRRLYLALKSAIAKYSRSKINSEYFQLVGTTLNKIK